MRKIWSLLILLMACVLMVGLVACGDDDDDDDGGDGTPTEAPTDGATETAAPMNEETVKIGFITSLSGRFGDYGAPFRDGAALAVQQINDAGGFQIGDTVYTFDLLIEDDRSEQDVAVQAATGLIVDEGVVALFGPIGPLGPSIADITATEGVLNFSSSSSVAAIAGPPDYPLVFTTIASAEARVSATVQSIDSFYPDAASIAILGPDDETSAALVPQFEDAFADKTVTSYTYPADQTDLSTVLTRLASDDPDLILMGWSITDNETQASQFDAAGIPADTPIFMYAQGISSCQSLQGDHPCIAHPLAGADLASADLTAERQQFIDDYLDFSGNSELPATSAAILWTYDFPTMLYEAMQAAASVDDTTAIADALRGGGVEITGLLGTISYDDANKVIHGFDISLVEPDGTVTTEHFE